MAIPATKTGNGRKGEAPLWEPAGDAVKCRLGGKHDPRTLERMTPERMHVKVSVCRKCHHVA